MTLGEGILWSTVLILTAAAVYQVSIRKWWKMVGKMVGVLVLIGGIIGAGVWGWFEYQDRPYVVEEIAGFRLGMTPLEVQIAKGEPTNTDKEPYKQDDEIMMKWIFGNSRSDRGYLVIFYSDTPNELDVHIVCVLGGITSLLGVHRTWPEDIVIERLGQPSHESISNDGLAKYISFEQWNVTFEIRKGQVSQLCISESGRIRYTVEYEGEQGERAE